MQPSDKEELRSIAIEACRHVFPACGIPIEGGKGPADKSGRAERLAGFIGFSSERMLGTLTIIAPVDLVRHSYPLTLPKGTTCELELFDWFGEVANRLMGRLKSAIARYGIVLVPSTPKVMLAEQLQMTTTESAVCELCFSAWGLPLQVLVDGVSRDGASLLEGALMEDDSIPEGEVLIFSMRPGGG